MTVIVTALALLLVVIAVCVGASLDTEHSRIAARELARSRRECTDELRELRTERLRLRDERLRQAEERRACGE